MDLVVTGLCSIDQYKVLDIVYHVRFFSWRGGRIWRFVEHLWCLCGTQIKIRPKIWIAYSSLLLASHVT